MRANIPTWRDSGSGSGRSACSNSTKPPARGQQAPLTPEYQAIFEANLAEVAKGGSGEDPVHTCIPEGMPRAMNLVLPMEVVITPNTTYILMEYLSMLRRIYTDGRAFPTDEDPSWMGYSIGKWVDEDGDGRYDVLEVETRNLKNPRTFDPSGIPVHRDGETVVKERFYLDKANPDRLYDRITVEDHALAHPWTVLKTMRREKKPIWVEIDLRRGQRPRQHRRRAIYARRRRPADAVLPGPATAGSEALQREEVTD